MKIFSVDSWINDRNILSDERIEAGTAYVAATYASRRTRARAPKGVRMSKLTVRVQYLVSK